MKVLLTGANGGFGHLAALSLARAGHDVVATMRNLDKGAGLHAALDAEGLSADFRRLDVGDEASVREGLGDPLELDCVVNNAGYEVRSSVEETTDELLRAQLDTNVNGPMRLIRAVLPSWRDRGSGVIVNLSSVAGKVGVPFGGAYAASKHAVEALSEALAWELGPYGIRVAVVEPGAFPTGFGDNAVESEGWDQSPYRARCDEFRDSMASLSGGVPQDSQLVADAIVAAVEDDDAPFRIPVGGDADLVIGAHRQMDFEGFKAAMTEVTGFE